MAHDSAAKCGSPEAYNHVRLVDGEGLLDYVARSGSHSGLAFRRWLFPHHSYPVSVAEQS
jgi:hypothetical protein